MTSLSTFVGDDVDQSSYGPEMMPEPSVQPVFSPSHRPECEPASQPEAETLEIECLCPFCGSFNSAIGKPCGNCKQEDNPITRAAIARKMGPWYVLQPNNPDAPGMNFDELVGLIRNQTVTSRSVIRGATTGQLWRLASKVRGLSREFGQCYSCSGDIENDETVCPHCDRSQTVQEHADAIPQPAPTPTPAPEVAVEPPSPKQVREALFAEPVIHVHSLSHPAPEQVDPVSASRPVVAERAERHFPKDDLLTPRDLAKAFQLEFGPDTLDRFLAKPNQTMKKLKIVMTSTAALSVAALLLWPLTHVVSGWINSGSGRAASPVANSTLPTLANTYTDARFTNAVAYAPSDRSMYPAMPNAATATPIVASAVMPPAAQAEPIPVPSPEDDPKLLWNSAMQAESTRNYASAVQAYERIESLPSNSWPANLETRLTLARKELKGDVR